MTRLAGIVTLSHTAPAEVRHLEFIKLSERRVLVILVINQDDVHNKVIEVDRDYSERELQEASQTLSRYLVGRSFESARELLQQELSEVRSDVNTIMEADIDIVPNCTCHQMGMALNEPGHQHRIVELMVQNCVGKALDQLFATNR